MSPERREEFLRRIEDIILNGGFRDLTMIELAERLHCSKSTLYGVAATKNALVTTIVRRFFEHATTRVEESAGQEPDHRRRIKVYLRGVGREMGRYSPEFYRDLVNHDLTARIYALNSNAAGARVRSMIDEGVRAGQFRAVDAAFASELVLLAIDGVRSGRLLERTGLSAGEAFTEIADLLLDGLQYVGRRSGSE